MTNDSDLIPTSQSTSSQEEGEWFIAINTMPVEHDRIVDSLLDKLGITQESGFMFSLIKSLSAIMPDEMYDKISTALFGGEANHSYISVCEIVDGQPVTREILHATGIEYDDNGQPHVSSEGKLTPMAYDETNFDKDPMYQNRLNKTDNTIKIVEGGKESIYQAYGKMLHAANQIADINPDYDFTGKNCNAFTAEALEAAGEFSSDLTSMGAGMKTTIFQTNAASATEEAPSIAALKNQINPDFMKPEATSLTQTPQNQAVLGTI